MLITKVIIHHGKAKYNQLKELETLLNASKINNNGRVEIVCHIESDLRSMRLKIAEIMGIRSTNIYFEYSTM